MGEVAVEETWVCDDMLSVIARDHKWESIVFVRGKKRKRGSMEIASWGREWR